MARIAIPVLGMSVQNYINCIEMLGHEPAVISELGDISDIDGLLLPGGGDIDPARYGQEMNGSWSPNKELDEFQLAVLDAFIKAGKPVLGICRGHQLINVYFGGTLVQDLPTAADHKMVELGDKRADNRHMIEAVEGTFLREIYGARFPVNSAHHQGIERVGKGLIVTARADDGVIEAAVHESLPVWSVQWHPERMCCDYASDDVVDGSKVIQYFIDQIG